jgi:hypothetical protein
MCGETHENQKTLNCPLALCTAAGCLLRRLWRHGPVYLGPVDRSLFTIQQAAAAVMCVVCCRRLLAEEDVAAGPGPISAAAGVSNNLIQQVQCIALNNARLLFRFLQLLCHAVGFLQSRAVRSSLLILITKHQAAAVLLLCVLCVIAGCWRKRTLQQGLALSVQQQATMVLSCTLRVVLRQPGLTQQSSTCT